MNIADKLKLMARGEFDGATYDPAQDRDRLQSQLIAVFRLLLDGKPRTPAELAEGTGWRETGASGLTARCRDLRKPKFGGFRVDCRQRPGAPRGEWEYRLVLGEK